MFSCSVMSDSATPRTATCHTSLYFTTSWSFLKLMSIGEGNGNPLWCSCLENPRDGGAWWAAIYGAAQSQTRLKWLSSSSNFSVDFWSWYKIQGDTRLHHSSRKQLAERSWDKREVRNNLPFGYKGQYRASVEAGLNSLISPSCYYHMNLTILTYLMALNTFSHKHNQFLCALSHYTINLSGVCDEVFIIYWL